MGFIGSPWEATFVCYKVRDIDAKFALCHALFWHVSPIFLKIKKKTCLEIILYLFR